MPGRVYARPAHPGRLSRQWRGWLFSYDVNSGTLAARAANASLYWPRYLRIHVQPAPAGS